MSPQDPDRIADFLIAFRAIARESPGWFSEALKVSIAPLIAFFGALYITRRQFQKEKGDRDDRERREETRKQDRRFRLALAKWAGAVHRYMNAQIAQATLHVGGEALRKVVPDANSLRATIEHNADLVRQQEEERAKGKSVDTAAFLLRTESFRLRTVTTDDAIKQKIRELEARTFIKSETPAIGWLERVVWEQEAIENEILTLIDRLPKQA